VVSATVSVQGLETYVMQPHASVGVGVRAIWVFEISFHGKKHTFSSAWSSNVGLRPVEQSTGFTQHVLAIGAGNLIRTIANLDSLGILDMRVSCRKNLLFRGSVGNIGYLSVSSYSMN
jgi:hypothetical protein